MTLQYVARLSLIATVVAIVAGLGSCAPDGGKDIRDAIGRQPPTSSGDAADGTKVYFWKTRDCDLAAATNAERKVTAVEASGNCSALRERLGL